jgi:hypothetical protein
MINLLKQQFNVKETFELLEEISLGMKECIPEIFADVTSKDDLQRINIYSLRYLVLNDLYKKVQRECE